MATPQEQLIGMMNPKTARLLDQQMRGQQVARDSQGAGMLSGMAQAYMNMANNVQDVVGVSPIGVNEQQAVQAQGQLQEMADAVRVAKGDTQSARLLNAAEKLESSGNPQAVIKAMQLREQASALMLKEQELGLQSRRLDVQAAANTIANAAKTASTDDVFDSEGNLFKQIVFKDGTMNLKPVGDSPENPVGEVRTAQEVNSENSLNRQINVAKSREHLDLIDGARTSYTEAKRAFASSSKVLGLVRKVKDDTGGFISTELAAVKRTLGFNDDVTVSVEELNKALKTNMLANLKATFGGNQITEGERNFLEKTMPSLMDSPELIARKAEANLTMQKKIMGRANSLRKTKTYTEYVDVESSHFDEDYNKLLEEYDDLLGGDKETGATGELTPDQIAANAAIERRKAMSAQQSRRGSGARIGTSL